MSGPSAAPPLTGNEELLCYSVFMYTDMLGHCYTSLCCVVVCSLLTRCQVDIY